MCFTVQTYNRPSSTSNFQCNDSKTIDIRFFASPARYHVLKSHVANSSTHNLANPKSPSLALKLESSITLLDFISLCSTHRSHSSCRYCKAEAKPRAILYLRVQANKLASGKRWESKLPFGMYS
ncbi:hypothetical protein RJ641_019077 [Dillenia turbinata]|uniref:Uncharacterized protein n=1 Tax=Dillenia turbinata TaxID=194707 RepID=A0AAN8YX27_9MAGN